jgi:hypothetical protein
MEQNIPGKDSESYYHRNLRNPKLPAIHAEERFRRSAFQPLIDLINKRYRE